jgi:hypothetical protein
MALLWGFGIFLFRARNYLGKANHVIHFFSDISDSPPARNAGRICPANNGR